MADDVGRRFAFITFYACFDQMQNNLVSQAGQMRTNGTPNDLLPAMNQVGCIAFAPVLSFLLYPQLHRRNIYPTAIARIRVGFVFVFLSMVWAAYVQYTIYNASPCYDQPGHCTFGKVSVWVQTPVYLLMAIGEAFALPAGMEFAENHSPKDARTVVQAVNPIVAALGSAVAMSITPAARDPHLIAFYGSLAGAMFVTTVAFFLLFRSGEERQIVAREDEGGLCLGVIACEIEKPRPGPPQLTPIARMSCIDLFGTPGISDDVAKPPLPRKSSKRPHRNTGATQVSGEFRMADHDTAFFRGWSGSL
jgi:POT family proton-dependent oligopeptide transporter